MLAYNATINALTGYSPFFLQHLRHARLPSNYPHADIPELSRDLPEWVQHPLDDFNVVYDTAARSLHLNALSAKRRYDLRRDVNTWFKPGDRVLLVKGVTFGSNAVKPKAELPNEGPFTILRALPYDRYMLSDFKTRRFRGTLHVSRLLPYFDAEPETSSRWMGGSSPWDKTGGRWPIQNLVGRRVRTLKKRDDELGLPAGAQLLEYKVRWVGCAQNHDRWREIQHLDGIFELVNEYDRHNPFTPSDAIDNAMKVVDCPEGPLPEPAEEARSRIHYQFHSNKGPPPDPSARAIPLPLLSGVNHAATHPQNHIESAEELREKLDDSLARLPVKTRVRVHFPRDDTWWTGTITKSWLPRWRIATEKLAHHIWVEYDDPRYNEPVEHNAQ